MKRTRTASGAEQAGSTRRSRLSRYAPPLVGIFAVLGVIVIGSASASEGLPVLPVYDGSMSFPEIHELSDPEEYSWEVSLDEGQELQSVDEQNAGVYYTEGHQLAFGISATAAHDADGSTVPTSIVVSGVDVITLVVHHRAGDPAANGAPFAYPVVAGEGWEGGSHAEIVAGPEDERELREERERMEREEREAAQGAGEGEASEGCLVPRLKGRSLRASKKRLEKAGCTIGRVRKLKGVTTKTGKVVKQNPKPGAVPAPGTTVKVTLGE